VFFHHFIFPAVAIAGAMLAWKNQWLGLSGFLISIPTICNWIGIAVFAIGVMMYGF